MHVSACIDVDILIASKCPNRDSSNGRTLYWPTLFVEKVGSLVMLRQEVMLGTTVRYVFICDAFGCKREKTLIFIISLERRV
jgi:hypothetical protein